MVRRHQQPRGLLLALTPLLGLAHRKLMSDSVAGHVLDQRVHGHALVDGDDGALEPVNEAVHVRLIHEILGWDGVR